MTSDGQHFFCGPATGTGSTKAGGHVGEIRAHALGVLRIGLHAQRFRGGNLRRELVLNQLGNDTPSGHEIDHRVGLHVSTNGLPSRYVSGARR